MVQSHLLTFDAQRAGGGKQDPTRHILKRSFCGSVKQREGGRTALLEGVQQPKAAYIWPGSPQRNAAPTEKVEKTGKLTSPPLGSEYGVVTSKTATVAIERRQAHEKERSKEGRRSGSGRSMTRRML